MVITMQAAVLLLVSQCQACSLGYFGQDCSLPCRFPGYGSGCQMACNCEKEHCNHITGCRNSTCSVGYFGPNCSLSCRSPNYGLGCQLSCNCEREHCTHIIGCQNATSDSRATTGSTSSFGCPFTTMNGRKSSHQRSILIAIYVMTTLSVSLIIVYVRLRMKSNAHWNST
uniref:Protein draper-like n=1 Tax=Crassostrea virginica TaxID=6565 RepID=A0A8B8AV67_CRAVI|nr:protein draper-like [Crassostrea virginica]